MARLLLSALLPILACQLAAAALPATLLNTHVYYRQQLCLLGEMLNPGLRLNNETCPAWRQDTYAFRSPGILQSSQTYIGNCTARQIQDGGCCSGSRMKWGFDMVNLTFALNRTVQIATSALVMECANNATCSATLGNSSSINVSNITQELQKNAQYILDSLKARGEGARLCTQVDDSGLFNLLRIYPRLGAEWKSIHEWEILLTARRGYNASQFAKITAYGRQFAGLISELEFLTQLTIYANNETTASPGAERQPSSGGAVSYWVEHSPCDIMDCECLEEVRRWNGDVYSRSDCVDSTGCSCRMATIVQTAENAKSVCNAVTLTSYATASRLLSEKIAASAAIPFLKALKSDKGLQEEALNFLGEYSLAQIATCEALPGCKVEQPIWYQYALAATDFALAVGTVAGVATLTAGIAETGLALAPAAGIAFGLANVACSVTNLAAFAYSEYQRLCVADCTSDLCKAALSVCLRDWEALAPPNLEIFNENFAFIGLQLNP